MGLLKEAIAASLILLSGGSGLLADSPSDTPVRAPLFAFAALGEPYREAEAVLDWTPPLPPPPVVVVPTETRPPPPPAAAIPLLPPVLLSSDADLQAALARSPWPPALWLRIVAIADCESSLNPAAIGDHGLAWGILQVRSDAHPALVARYDVFTLDGALAAAWVIYQSQGLSAWSCAR